MKSVSTGGKRGRETALNIQIIKESSFRLLIKDELGTPVFRIEGPCWTGSCMGSDVEFKVLSVESEEQVFIYFHF